MKILEIALNYIYLEPTSSISDEREEINLSLNHTFNDNYSIKKEVFNSLGMNSKVNKKTYNSFANAVDNSDLTFFLDNSTLKNAMKKKENRESLEKANYDTIEYNEEMSVSERMEAYNTIISKLTKL